MICRSEASPLKDNPVLPGRAATLLNLIRGKNGYVSHYHLQN
ncbi:hypothetical protein R69927_00853 [Paraburkholderia domus]|jgi:hypothetical protein|uniref:Uncharacterized protein n=1 Tax=Paraburkholderia domus TaxID=2793075 RepID=A0A9N8MLF5_9BURK|nr:hypothetical protein R70006_02453 [Paraburkholderia domus]CAE6772727.1 hypothetical protein R69749_01318 [Paraburkholderia domus]CAE6825368.1 hypothetical protein R69927_00853 [Paraburkholderia domus]CAE6868292.1 hypothetical protein R70211_00994 [Paraburkholderia domus]CAE6872717.1 hypothetical protein R75471_01085 [Paraburkholderia domus]